MSYRLIIERLDGSASGNVRWCLDLPQAGDTADYDALAQDGIWLQGWLLASEKKLPGKLMLVAQEQIELPLDRQRPDVIRTILSTQPDGHALLSCGFRQRVVLAQVNTLCWYQQGRCYELARIHVEGSLTPLAGMDGWLFLDNDTNSSVEQFTGRALIERQQLNEWQQYFSALLSLQSKYSLAAVKMLLAPSKEAVYPSYYPYAAGKNTALQQLLSLSEAQGQLIYPGTLFQQSKYRTYRKTDTHWSCYGAMLASLQLYGECGFDASRAAELFEQDSYQDRSFVGDLGNKMYPPQSSQEVVLRNYSHRRFVVFDNELPNFGRVRMVTQPEALQHSHCVVFGSSSSYSMLDYLSRLFRYVTLIHSAGNVDDSILNLLQVDQLITQSNARYILKAPQVGYSLATDVQEKFLKLPKKAQRKFMLRLNADHKHQEHPGMKAMIPLHREWLSGVTIDE